MRETVTSSNRTFLLLAAAIAAIALAALPWAVDPPQLLFGSRVSVLSPSVFPAIAAIAILVLSAVEWLRSHRGGEESPDDTVTGHRGKGLSALTILLIAAALALEPLGYPVTCALVSMALALIMGCRAPVPLIGVCVGVPLLVYWLLREVFSIYLPVFG